MSSCAFLSPQEPLFTMMSQSKFAAAAAVEETKRATFNPREALQFLFTCSRCKTCVVSRWGVLTNRGMALAAHEW